MKIRPTLEVPDGDCCTDKWTGMCNFVDVDESPWSCIIFSVDLHGDVPDKCAQCKQMCSMKKRW